MTGRKRRTVVVAVTTYLRPSDLAELLPVLGEQADSVAGEYDVRIVVVDNDAAGSARAMVSRDDSRLRYVCEPEPGIAAARNRALTEAADADVLVFIDDDERPSAHWLARLLETWRTTGAQAVAGPVLTEAPADLDPWIEQGGFLNRNHRAALPTGTQIANAATNNLLLDLAEVRRTGLRFNIAFGLSGGEDTLFTRMFVAGGARIVWDRDASVSEKIRPERLNRSWFLRRAFSYGSTDARVNAYLAATGGPRARARAKSLGDGASRIAAGAGLATFGWMSRSYRRRAWGLQMLYRGVGLVAGGCGVSHLRYARPVDTNERPSVTGARR